MPVAEISIDPPTTTAMTDWSDPSAAWNEDVGFYNEEASPRLPSKMTTRKTTLDNVSSFVPIQLTLSSSSSSSSFQNIATAPSTATNDTDQAVIYYQDTVYDPKHEGRQGEPHNRHDATSAVENPDGHEFTGVAHRAKASARTLPHISADASSSQHQEQEIKKLLVEEQGVLRDESELNDEERQLYRPERYVEKFGRETHEQRRKKSTDSSGHNEKLSLSLDNHCSPLDVSHNNLLMSCESPESTATLSGDGSSISVNYYLSSSSAPSMEPSYSLYSCTPSLVQAPYFASNIRQIQHPQHKRRHHQQLSHVNSITQSFSTATDDAVTIGSGTTTSDITPIAHNLQSRLLPSPPQQKETSLTVAIAKAEDADDDSDDVDSNATLSSHGSCYPEELRRIQISDEHEEGRNQGRDEEQSNTNEQSGNMKDACDMTTSIVKKYCGLRSPSEIIATTTIQPSNVFRVDAMRVVVFVIAFIVALAMIVVLFMRYY